ncbi:MAG: hypothetical protein WDZ28_03465 [Simkaniaceae bacterium]
MFLMEVFFKFCCPLDPAPIHDPNPAPIQDPNPAPIQDPNPAPVQDPNPAPIQDPNPVLIQDPNPAPIQDIRLLEARFSNFLRKKEFSSALNIANSIKKKLMNSNHIYKEKIISNLFYRIVIKINDSEFNNLTKLEFENIHITAFCAISNITDQKIVNKNSIKFINKIKYFDKLIVICSFLNKIDDKFLKENIMIELIDFYIIEEKWDMTSNLIKFLPQDSVEKADFLERIKNA